MTENGTKQITERELREAELQMTGRPPAPATGFIGFVPAPPGTSGSSTSDGKTTGGTNTPPQTDKQ